MGSIPIGISASRGSAVLGLNQYKTTVEAWLEIMEQLKPGFCKAHKYKIEPWKDKPQFTWGLYFEDAVIDIAEKVSCDEIINRERFDTGSGKFDFVTSHIDGKYYRRNKLHEGKTSNRRSFDLSYGEPGSAMVPTYIQVQCQHQMYTTGAVENVVSVLVFPKTQDELDKLNTLEDVDSYVWASVLNEMGMFHQFVLPRSEKGIKDILDHYEKFWRVNVLEEKEPNPNDYDDMRRLFPEPIGTVVANDRIEELSREYKGIGAEIKSIEKRKDDLKREIIKYGRNQGIENGFNIDDDSAKKMLIMNRQGEKIHSFNGKMFR